MNLKRAKHILYLLLSAAFFSIGSTVKAEPAPPKLVVNHETQECAEIFGGDECMDCFPPEGWEVLGWAYESECPAGYSFTEVKETCLGFKNEFCCTQGHSGAAGDCEDLVINSSEDQCAFVDDVNACNLPRGWESRSDEVSSYAWVCPGSNHWIDDLKCLTEGETGSDSRGLPFQCGGTALGLIFLFGAVGISKKKQKIG